MGAVLHTLNVRLFPEQLRYVIDHAEDKVIIADAMLAPALARVLDDRGTVEHVIVVGCRGHARRSARRSTTRRSSRRSHPASTGPN